MTEKTPSFDWSTVKPADIPKDIVDRLPRLIELRIENDALKQDVMALHAALKKFGGIASAIHTIIEPLEDVNLVALTRLSGPTVERLGIKLNGG